MALTSTGLNVKRLPTILSELEASLKLELGADVDLSSDSLFGIINSIYSVGLADQWSLAQAVYDAFNIDTAEGKQLDDLVALVGLTRLAPSPTTGLIEFTGTQGTVVPKNSAFSDSSGNTYITPTSVTISIVDCTKATILVSNVADTTPYQLIIEGNIHNFVSGVGATTTSIVAGLVALIGVQSAYTASSSVDGTQLIITSNNTLDSIAISLSTGLTSTSVVSTGNVNNTQNGVLDALANTITTINTPVLGLTSVNNPSALTVGRAEETDIELRTRQKDSVQIAGTATVPAIEASLKQVQGVTQAFLIENRTLVTDGDGRPAKSYESVVEGGSDTAVASKIWETKPAGVETYGNTTQVVVDGQGNNQTVRFSRPESQYLWIKVTYNKYDEEAFPTNGEDAIAEAIAAEGNTYELGEDVIPKRFYGAVYSAVSGIQDLVITAASSGTDPNTEPSAPSFLESALSIEGAEVAKFDTSRITVTLV